jgi:hypothetical protein
MNISLSAVLGVGIGLFLVYYVLSLIVSWVASQIAAWTNLRSSNLKTGLEELLGASGFANFSKLERIQNLESKYLPILGAVRSNGLQEVPTSAFSQAFLQLLKLNLKEGNDLTKELKAALVQASADGHIAETTKTILEGMVDLDVTDPDKIRKSIGALFDETMIKVSSLYKQRARRIAIVVSLVVTVILGIDSIAIAKHLSRMPSLQPAINAKVDEYLAEQPDEDLQTYIAELEDLNLPLFWDFDSLPKDIRGCALKVAGLLITWLAASQGSSFWYQVLKRARSVTSTPPETSAAET